MSDNKTLEERSRNMAAIKGKDTKPEVFIRKLLFTEGYRYRTQPSYIPGHPDLWLKKYNTAIFVNGCFWHRHDGCKYAYIPKTRTEFWNSKFEQNIQRDLLVREQLKERGIRCLVVWECSIRRIRKKNENPNTMLNKILAFFHSEDCFDEI